MSRRQTLRVAPRTHVGIGLRFPVVQVRDHAKHRFLGEVVAALGAGEVCGEPPDVGLDLADEPVERHVIAVATRTSSCVTVEHSGSVCR